MDSAAEPSRSVSAEPNRDSYLQKGGACVFCRRRKMKCDGRKPVCGPCERADRAHECEYADSHGLSKADYLEEDIRRVEHRIYELENPEKAVGTSVFLHHPHERLQRRGQIPSMLQVLESESSTHQSPGSVPTTDEWWNAPEPPVSMVQNLIDTFLQYASDWGFFLDDSRFRRDVLLDHPIGHHSRPSPALLAAVYLIGIALNDSPALKAHENTFLSRALSSLPASLSGIHPRKAIHALQAEILLSNYFYVSGRYLEGRYHTAAAVSLAVSTVLPNPSATTLRHDKEAIEEVERIEACWKTIILDKAWAVAKDTHPNLRDSSKMLDMPRPDVSGSSPSTISQVLDGADDQTVSISPKTLISKAVIVWERANCFVWEPAMGLNESNEFWAAFTALDTRIAGLQQNMVSMEPAPHSPSMRRAAVVGRSMVHAAVIQLHRTPAQTSMESKDKCLAAAKTILQLPTDVDLLGSTFICPILFVGGFTWAIVRSLILLFCADDLGGRV
ncbi:hypothetical protein K438DRAFT_553221 [Mycena galopus ATCC 62051]|nr:hypothetical protein K438DRAFT_553221 [Mycena galopus ATCC 62051]